MLNPALTPFPLLSSTITPNAVIDQTLQLVASETYRLDSRLRPGMITLPTLAHLRAGPLGRDLARLAAVASGQVREPSGQVVAAIDAVLQVLFWPAGADDYTVPRTFWDTDLGRLLARAKLRAFAPSDLIGIGAAAEQLGVSRPTVYRWMDEGSLDYVHDEMSGRMFVVRREGALRLQVSAKLPPASYLETSPAG